MSTSAFAPVRVPWKLSRVELPPAEPPRRAWSDSLRLALATYHCVKCFGKGASLLGATCGCVKRRVFRYCLDRWRSHELAPRMTPRRTSASVYGYVDREFAADFLRAAREACSDDQWRVLHLTHVRGVDYVLGCRMTGLSKGNWFHRLYEAEEATGQACYERMPYGLYPIDQYFSHRQLPCLGSITENQGGSRKGRNGGMKSK